MATIEIVTKMEIPDEFGSYQVLESEVQEAMFSTGRLMMERLFALYEESILKKRKLFCKKDLREKQFDTLVGRIKRRRWRVWDVRNRRYRYPLDEWLQLSKLQRVTPGLTNAIVKSCVDRPYRQATNEIERWTGVKRKAMTNWNLIQKVAEERRESEPPIPNWYLKPIPSLDPKFKSDPCPILAIDPDATYCHNQKKLEKDHEVKVAVLYTGKKPEDGKKKRWRLINKRLVISRSGETPIDFFNRVSQVAMSYYGAHLHSRIIIHGDGDPWIKGLKINYWDQALLRLDPWHVLKKMRLATGLKELPSEWVEAVWGKPDQLVGMLRLWVLQKTAPQSPARQKMDDLISYLKNNREGLLPSGVSKEIKEKYPRMFKRGSGTIESNIGHAFNRRFKQPRMSWSANGKDNLSYLREIDLNGGDKPKYRVPKPLTRKVA